MTTSWSSEYQVSLYLSLFIRTSPSCRSEDRRNCECLPAESIITRDNPVRDRREVPEKITLRLMVLSQVDAAPWKFQNLASISSSSRALCTVLYTFPFIFVQRSSSRLVLCEYELAPYNWYPCIFYPFTRSNRSRKSKSSIVFARLPPR